MFYNNLKKFIKKFPTLWKFLRWFKDSLIKLSRLKDVFMMMIMFHIWPKQTYKFSTRRHLPCKKNRFSKQSKPVIPYDLLRSKSSNIPMMKEINIVGIGSSFDLNNLKDLKGPIFFSPAWSPLRIDKNGNIFYKHFYSYGKGKFMDFEELFSDQTYKEFKINVTYVNGRKKVVEKFKKNGNNVLSIKTYKTDKDGNHYPLDKDSETPSYLNMFDHDQCRFIAVVEKIYKPPILPPYTPWAPTKSFLQTLCALSFFAEKINVYGWDFYLDSSPENMSYWQLFFNMYKSKLDIVKGKTKEHFESALINFYYGYQLSKLPHIKIHGYMGQLGKHHKLIRRIEKVLFNHK
jgi:hypothetical protein